MRRTVLVLAVLLCGLLCGVAQESAHTLISSPQAESDPTPPPQQGDQLLDARHGLAPQTGPHRPPVHFSFAVPDYDSRISLGVFDASGKLIRTIASARPESEFQIGTNGLISQWDWNDESGNPVPEGEYAIRGFAVGEFEQSGVAEFVISWGSAFGAGLEIKEIRQLGIGCDGVLFILGTDAADLPALLAYDPEREARLWSRTLGQKPGENWLLGQPASPALAVMGDGELQMIEPSTGRVLLRGRVAGADEEVYSLRLAGEELQWVTDSGVKRVSMVDLAPLEPPRGLPSRIVRYYDDDGGAMALDKDGRLWVSYPGWTIFLNQEGAWFRDFIPGREGRFWALVRERHNGEQRLGQFHRGGEFLRQIHPRTFQGQPAVFAVGSDETTLFVLSKNAEGQDRQLVGIRQKIMEGPHSWETFWEKRLDAEEVLQREGFRNLPLRMNLEVTSALGQGREASVFRLLVKSAGIGLATPDGLHLGTLWDAAGIRAASASPSPENPRALRFLILKDDAIQEGEASGLDRIAALNVGSFVWPPEEN